MWKLHGDCYVELQLGGRGNDANAKTASPTARVTYDVISGIPILQRSCTVTLG